MKSRYKPEKAVVGETKVEEYKKSVTIDGL